MSSVDVFPGVLGHARPVQTLLQAMRTQRVHHAYPFAGLDGIGKARVALRLAQSFNCVGQQPTPGVPCLECTHCTRIESRQHPDFLFVSPDTSKSRPIIKIDVVRDLLRQVHFRPYEAKRRVIVIEGAEFLAEEGSNALLKTLEEPTGETSFVLITAQARRLLTTIRSRCQLVRFAPLTREQIVSLLAQHNITGNDAEVAAAFADGSFGAALRLCEEGVLESRKSFLQEVCGLEQEGALGVFDLASRYARGDSRELQRRLDALRIFWRDVVLLQSRATPTRVINTDMRPQLQRLAAKLTVEQALGHIEHIGRAQRDLLGYVDARLVLENLLFSMMSSFSTASKSSAR